MAFKRSVTDKKINYSLLRAQQICLGSMQFTENTTRGQCWPKFSGLFLPLSNTLSNSGIL